MRPVHVLYVQSADAFTGRSAGRSADAGAGRDPEPWRILAELLEDVTPVVEARPPDAVLADVRGSTRYFGRDAVELARMVRVRALARYGLECTVGVAASPMLARMAAQDGAPGAVRWVGDDPAEVSAFLRARPVAALEGVGPATARTLCAYGLDSVGRVAEVEEAVLLRILGTRKGHLLHERARGVDRRPVVPNAPTRSLSADHRFDRHELDAEVRRRALLGLCGDLGRRLRTAEQVARALTLTVRYADRSVTTRTRALPEPTAHTPALADLTHALHDALGLQRARVCALSLRAEDLTAAALSHRQLSFGDRAENARRLESVVDRITARWPGAAGPAALVGLTGQRS